MTKNAALKEAKHKTAKRLTAIGVGIAASGAYVIVPLWVQTGILAAWVATGGYAAWQIVQNRTAGPDAG